MKDTDITNELISVKSQPGKQFSRKNFNKAFLHIGGRPVKGGTPSIVKLSTYTNKICNMD